MLHNYFITAIRNFWRQKTYSLINIAGLSVGLACSFLIFVWVDYELNWDQFLEDGHRIHRLMRNHHGEVTINTRASVPGALASFLKNEYPEVSETVLVAPGRPAVITYDDKIFREPGSQVDASFFQVFSFPLIQGNSELALADPDHIAISQRLAEKLFGNDWKGALGKTVVMNQSHSLWSYRDRSFEVNAIFENIPQNSSLRFEFLLPMSTYAEDKSWLYSWTSPHMRLFVQLAKGVDLDQLNGKIRNLIVDHNASAKSFAFLQPYMDVHLHSEFRDGKIVGGRIDYIHMFITVAVFILIIASINFMNLSTARSAQRAQEIGIRKTVGAGQSTLVGQFLGESLLVTTFAGIVALVLVVLVLPAFSNLTNQNLTLDFLRPQVLLIFLAIVIGTGLIAGSYPAFYLAGFNPIGVLHGTSKPRSGSVNLRQILVVFQFALSIVLIIGTLTVYSQINYITSKDIGLDRENLIYTNLEGTIKNQYESFRNELLQKPGIVNVTSTSHSPLRVQRASLSPTWPGKDPQAEYMIHIITGNYDYLETMDIKLLEGRGFSRDFPSDATGFIVNRELARIMNVEEAVGHPLKHGNREGQIVGVVKDFHFRSLYEAIEPLIIQLQPSRTELVYIRAATGQTKQAIESLEWTFKKFNPNLPFEVFFQDVQFEQMYQNEQTMGTLATCFAVLAVFVSSLGLFGLVSFSAEQRTKEIGIRKILGATTPNLVNLLSREFLKLVAVAFTLAAPISYYFMSGWLQDFAYHTSLGWQVFFFAGTSSLIIAFVTVSYQATKAALADPIDSLRYE